MRRSSGSTCVVLVAGKNRKLQAHSTMFAETAKQVEHVVMLLYRQQGRESFLDAFLGSGVKIRSKRNGAHKQTLIIE